MSDESPAVPAPDEGVRLMRDGLINVSAPLVSGLIALWLVPVMLRGLGAESYGLLLATTAIAGTVATVDMGLSLMVTRRVAAGEIGAEGDRAQRFVRAAGGAYLMLGIVGGLVIGVLGLWLRDELHLSPAHRAIALPVFMLAGATFCGDRVLVFAMAVLAGLRRFRSANELAIVASAVRAAGIGVLLRLGAGVVPVAAWQAATSLLIALAAMLTVGAFTPLLRFGMRGVGWSAMRDNLASGVMGAVAIAIDGLYGQVPQLLLAGVGGASWVAIYYTAQRFPFMIMLLLGRAAIAVMPAAAAHLRANDEEGLRGVLDAGTRWVMILVVPLFLVLWIVAPALLKLWLGEASVEGIGILRLTALAVLVDGLGMASLDFLWGCGRVKALLVSYVSIAVILVASGLWLLERIGITGVAWALVLSSATGTTILLYSACRVCGEQPGALLRKSMRGLLPPALACAAATWLVLQLGGSWPVLVAACAAGGGGYAAVLFAAGAREEEKVFARQMLRAVLPGRSST